MVKVMYYSCMYTWVQFWSQGLHRDENMVHLRYMYVYTRRRVISIEKSLEFMKKVYMYIPRSRNMDVS